MFFVKTKAIGFFQVFRGCDSGQRCNTLIEQIQSESKSESVVEPARTSSKIYFWEGHWSFLTRFSSGRFRSQSMMEWSNVHGWLHDDRTWSIMTVDGASTKRLRPTTHRTMPRTKPRPFNMLGTESDSGVSLTFLNSGFLGLEPFAMGWFDGDFVAEVVSKVLEVPITLSDTQKQVEYGSPGRVVRAVVRLLKHRCSCLAEKNCTKLQAFSEKKTVICLVHLLVASYLMWWRNQSTRQEVVGTLGLISEWTKITSFSWRHDARLWRRVRCEWFAAGRFAGYGARRFSRQQVPLVLAAGSL